MQNDALGTLPLDTDPSDEHSTDVRTECSCSDCAEMSFRKKTRRDDEDDEDEEDTPAKRRALRPESDNSDGGGIPERTRNCDVCGTRTAAR